MKRRSIILTTVLLATAGTAPAATADRPDRSRVVTFPVVGNYVEPLPGLDGLVCRGLTTPHVGADTCRGRFTGVSYFTGSLFGEQRYDIEGWVAANGQAPYEGIGVYTGGGITGCGKGGFVVEETDGYIDLPKTNPVTGASPGFNRWRIRPGSGTGELAGRLLGGEGVNHWTAYFGRATSTANDFGNGRFTGVVRCRR